MKTEHKILASIEQQGGRLYRVGGCVRDAVLGLVPKDIDYLVTGLSLEQVQQAVSSLGHASEVGRSFGIVTALIDGDSYDFALPRTEQSTGAGHRDFEVLLDSNLSVVDDLARRDFTINAIAYDVECGVTIDPFGGAADLQSGVIRAVGDARDRFTEDPLRILRAVQFASRLGFSIDDTTFVAALEMSSTLLSCSPERIQAELHKAFIKSFNTEVLCGLLRTTIGTSLFGVDFDPKPVDLQGLSLSDRDAVGFVSLFASGKPDLSYVSPTSIQLSALQAFRSYTAGVSTKAVHSLVRSRELYNYVSLTLRCFCCPPSYFEARCLNKSTQDIPLFPKELALTGGDLVSLGFSGASCGVVQRKLLDAIYARSLLSDKASLISFVATLR